MDVVLGMLAFAGVCLLVGGAYAQFGGPVAMLVGGFLLIWFVGILSGDS